MARIYNQTTLNILKFLADTNKAVQISDIKNQAAAKMSSKNFYNYLFRLSKDELILKTHKSATITNVGRKLLKRLLPEKDGVWKLVIFDIPEKHKYVRAVLRAKLKQLHFKKWQNSIWVSPYALDEDIEAELSQLGKKFFVRLIKTTQINDASDLEKIFE